MRVTSDLFVAAVLRRVFSAGGFAAIEKRGHEQAGAIFVIARERSGQAALYGPAAQTSYDGDRPADRRFALYLDGEGSAIDARLAKERRFDPDIWIVEVEARDLPIAQLLSITTP